MHHKHHSNAIRNAAALIDVLLLINQRPPGSALFPYTTLFRSCRTANRVEEPEVLGKLFRAVLFFHRRPQAPRSEEHTSELQSRFDLVCRLLLEKKNKRTFAYTYSLTYSSWSGYYVLSSYESYA